MKWMNAESAVVALPPLRREVLQPIPDEGTQRLVVRKLVRLARLQQVVEVAHTPPRNVRGAEHRHVGLAALLLADCDGPHEGAEQRQRPRREGGGLSARSLLALWKNATQIPAIIARLTVHHDELSLVAVGGRLAVHAFEHLLDRLLREARLKALLAPRIIRPALLPPFEHLPVDPWLAPLVRIL